VKFTMVKSQLLVTRDSELLRKKLDFINLRAILINFLGSLLFAEVLFTCLGSVVHIV
jgi:hypothetical protein